MEKVFDLFLKEDGRRMTDVTEWMTQREAWKQLLMEKLYGTFPEVVGSVTSKVIESKPMYDGRAVLEHIVLSFGEKKTVKLPITILRPNKTGKSPVIVWNRHGEMEVCPVEEKFLCEQGIVLASFIRSDLIDDGPKPENIDLLEAYPGYTWGRIAQWAFGMRVLLSYVLQQNYCDVNKVVASGHSRGGKTSICAAIYDERFTMCHANGSGCLGAGSLRIFGGHFGLGFGEWEKVADIASSFPYWWGEGLQEYADGKEPPFDGHLLRALIAPRAILTTEGCGDDWSNPYGTQIMWRAAQEVYEFLSCREHNAIHYREGGHRFHNHDWEALLDYMQFVFEGKPLTTNVVCFKNTDVENARFDWRWERPYYDWRCPEK